MPEQQLMVTCLLLAADACWVECYLSNTTCPLSISLPAVKEKYGCKYHQQPFQDMLTAQLRSLLPPILRRLSLSVVLHASNHLGRHCNSSLPSNLHAYKLGAAFPSAGDNRC